MIRVLDERKSVKFYSDAFGLSVAGRLDFDSFTLIYLSNCDSTFELELTVNKGTETLYELGNSYGHLAVSVDDLDAEHARMSELALEPRKIVDFAKDGVPVARFLFIVDPDGYQIEILQRSGRFL